MPFNSREVRAHFSDVCSQSKMPFNSPEVRAHSSGVHSQSKMPFNSQEVRAHSSGVHSQSKMPFNSREVRAHSSGICSQSKMTFNSPEVRAHSSGIPLGYPTLVTSYNTVSVNPGKIESFWNQNYTALLLEDSFRILEKKEKQNCLLLVTTPVSESKNKYFNLCFTTQFWNPENSHLLHCQFWNTTTVLILNS